MTWSLERLAQLRAEAETVLELTKWEIGTPTCPNCDLEVGYQCELCRLEIAARDLARCFLVEHETADRLTPRATAEGGPTGLAGC